MRKASDILLIIGAVFCILGAIGCLIATIVLFVMASPEYTQYIIDAIKAGTVHSDIPGTPEEIAAIVQASLRIAAIACIFALLFQVAAAVLSFVAKAKATTGLYIASLVLGVLAGNVLTLLGSIFGLVGVNEQQQQQP